MVVAAPVAVAVAVATVRGAGATDHHRGPGPFQTFFQAHCAGNGKVIFDFVVVGDLNHGFPYLPPLYTTPRLGSPP